MKRKTEQLLKKAQDSIEAAVLLSNANKRSIAAGRAYYAMFYVAEALLYERKLEFSKHSGVHAAFRKNFAKTGEMDPKFHRYGTGRRSLPAASIMIEGSWSIYESWLYRVLQVGHR